MNWTAEVADRPTVCGGFIYQDNVRRQGPGRLNTEQPLLATPHGGSTRMWLITSLALAFLAQARA